MDSIINYVLSKECNHFINFEERCKLEYNKPVHSMAELRTMNNKKIRGDIFEEFAKLYFKHIYNNGLENVYLLHELPEEDRLYLNMEKQDLGIDLIAKDDDKYYAIQVKFRSRNKYKQKTGIGWKQLSTFYALVNKTGPWFKHIIFTNADYVRHVGRKTKKDYSICRGTLLKLNHMDFVIMSQMEGNVLKGKNEVDIDEMRRKRLERFG